MNIKDLRLQTGLSQAEFGERLGGIPIRTIQDWEAGKRRPPLYIVDLIKFKIENDPQFEK